MGDLELALGDGRRTAIVLVLLEDEKPPVGDPDWLGREARAELARRIFGRFAIEDFDHFAAREISLPRYCRALASTNSCVFAYGLAGLRANDAARYQDALTALNNHREDLRESRVPVVLWLSPECYQDVITLAPDFASWRTATIAFRMPAGRNHPSTPIGALGAAEADRLRRQAARYREALSRPNLDESLAADLRARHAELALRLGEEAIRAEGSSLAAIRENYLNYVIRECQYVDFRGIPQTERALTLPLDEVYVSLTAERERVVDRAPFDDPERDDEREDGADGAGKSEDRDEAQARRDAMGRLPREVVSEPVDLPAAIREHPRAVILGDPGAGKTTLARFVALHFARACREGLQEVRDKEGNLYGATRLPIFVRVAAFADALSAEPDLGLREFLPRAFKDAGVDTGDLAALFGDALDHGAALLILDGLDEVAKAADRVKIASRIDALASSCGDHRRVIVTSRIAGYADARLGSLFAQFTMREMTDEDIGKFLRRWCVSCERFHRPDDPEGARAQRGEEECSRILAEIEASEGVRRLAGNPLLLTILCLIHRAGGRLPERRVELYEVATKTLLRDWRLQQAKTQAREVTEWEAEELLGPLAYHMHEHEPTGLIEESDAKALLRGWLAEARGLAPNHPEVAEAVEDFLRRVREQSGLFVERARGRCGFLHLTFEEYFAAREIVGDPTTAADRIRAHRHQSRWEEVIRLAIASQRPRFATQLIRAAIWHADGAAATTGYVPSEYEDILHRDLFLAARCIGDCVGVDASLAREVSAAVVSIALRSNPSGALDTLVLAAREGLRALGDTEAGTVAQDALVDASRHGDPNVRSAALRALGCCLHDLPCIDARLLASLGDADDTVRTAAAKTLGNVARYSPEMVRPLVVALRDPEWEVRYAAARAVGRMAQAGEAAREALRSALGGDDGNLGSGIALALCLLGEGSGAVGRSLRTALMDDRDMGPLSIMLALAEVGDGVPATLPILLAWARDEDATVRYAAVSALAVLGRGSLDALHGLLPLLEDEDASVRHGAAEAAGMVAAQSAEMVSELLGALRSTKRVMRKGAASALGCVPPGSAATVNALAHALDDEDTEVQIRAARALGKAGRGSSRAVDALAAALANEHYGVRCAAAIGLGCLGCATDDVLDRLMALLGNGDGEARYGAVAALGMLGSRSPRARLAVLSSLNDRSSSVRAEAVRSLRVIGAAPEEALEPLLVALRDDFTEVRHAAARALASVGGGSSIAAEALVAAMRDQEWAVRSVIAEAVGDLGNTSSVVLNALTDALDDHDPDVRDAAWQSLSILVQRREDERA